MHSGEKDRHLALVEQWFEQRGVPNLGANLDRERLLSQALPLLVLAYALGGLKALELDRSLTWNLGALAVVVVVLVLAWVLANRVRGRRGLSRPERIGLMEMGVFLIGPTLPTLVLREWRDAAIALAVGAGVLALVAAASRYGLVPIGLWVTRRITDQLSLLGLLLVRALTFLLLFITFLFVNAEVWQVAGNLNGAPYPVTIGLFVLLGAAFAIGRVPSLISPQSDFSSWGEVREAMADTPAAALDTPLEGDPDETALTWREWGNVALVALVGQALQVTFVVAGMFGFFVLFGLLTISADIASAWTGIAPADVRVFVDIGASDGRLVITEPLLRVSGFLAAFTGMYFTVVLSTDSTYRAEFAEDVGPSLRELFAARLAYRWATGQANS